MRLFKLSSDGFVFQVSRREKEILLTLLKLYPRIPPGHHQLTKLTDTESSSQALLEESLAEQRAENQRQVHKLLAQHSRWIQSDQGWRLSLAEDEMEWLLQVLNDIRVGSWILLGSPDANQQAPSEEAARDFWVMEVAGAFQVALLEALEGKP